MWNISNRGITPVINLAMNNKFRYPIALFLGKFCYTDDRLIVQNYALARWSVDYRQYADSTGCIYYLADHTGCTDGEKAITFAC